MFVEIKKLLALSCDCKKINVGVYIEADAVSMNKGVYVFFSETDIAKNNSNCASNQQLKVKLARKIGLLVKFLK